jgi:hypothetical protein
VPSLRSLKEYLSAVGWAMADEDDRTSVWRPDQSLTDEFVVVLPAREDFRDYGQLVYESLRVLAYAEHRSVEEVSADITYGAADTVAARLVPDAPPGEAPLSLAYSALSALRSYVIGSGSALDNHALVLPASRPLRAEAYVSKVRVATQPGSFILTLALPLFETFDEAPRAAGEISGSEAEPVQEPLLEVPPQPFGRRVTDRMAAVARNALVLADAVNSGDRPLSAFGMPGTLAANATELEALSGLGGPERSTYRLRFAQSSVSPAARDAVVLQVTPGQQRVMAEAADYLRTEQPRADVTAEGVVVRLSRDHHFGPGVVVIEGIADDSGAVRRFYAELTERDYDEAIRAHSLGLRVVARGDLITRGSYKWLRPGSAQRGRSPSFPV